MSTITSSPLCVLGIDQLCSSLFCMIFSGLFITIPITCLVVTFKITINMPFISVILVMFLFHFFLKFSQLIFINFCCLPVSLFEFLYILLDSMLLTKGEGTFFFFIFFLSQHSACQFFENMENYMLLWDSSCDFFFIYFLLMSFPCFII